jgi:hypothetical protein
MKALRKFNELREDMTPERRMRNEIMRTPADAPLLRALAVDVEQDAGYVFGEVTASRLRALADKLASDTELPHPADIAAAYGDIQTAADELDAAGEETLELVFLYVAAPSGKYTALGLDAARDVLKALEDTK